MKKFVRIVGMMLVITCLAGCSSDGGSSKLPSKGSSEFHAAGKKESSDNSSESTYSETATDSASESDVTVSDNTTSDTSTSDNSVSSANSSADTSETGSNTSSYYNTDFETAYYISDEAKQILQTVPTDYSKVHWGVVYSGEGMDGLIISVAPYVDGDLTCLVVGFTNIYNETITFTADGYAKDSNGNDIGSIYEYQSALGAGSTVIYQICCNGLPTGEIHWNSVELNAATSEYQPWESTWTLNKDEDGYFYSYYEMESSSKMRVGDVWLLVLDSKGNIIKYGDDYNPTEGTEANGEVNFYTKEFGTDSYQIAMFANPEAIE